MMIRRKLFAYTALFIAGITAGYFIFERGRVLSGTLFLTAVSMATCLADHKGAGTRRSIKAAGSTTSRISKRSSSPDTSHILLISLAAGLIMFSVRYAAYSNCLKYDEGITGQQEPSPQEYLNENENETLISEIEGYAESVTVKDGKLRIMLSDTSATRYGIKVLVTVKNNGIIEASSDTELMTEGIGNEGGDGYDYKSDSDSDNDYDYGPCDVIGHRIRAYGTLREASTADNPGCFDYRIYLRSRGAGYLFSADRIVIDNSNHTFRGRYLGLLYRIREHYLDQYEDDEIRGFLKGTVFGDKSDIDEEIMNDFNENGTGHILAVSGLHTGFLYSMLRFISRRRRTVMTTILTIAILIMYGDMTMWSPSAERAIIVLSVSLLSIYAKRPFDLLSSVSAAAIIILVREPYQLFASGFQLSFMAIMGIAFLSPPLKKLIGEPLGVPIAVQAGILPVTAYIYHRINLLSIFINIPIIYLASILVPMCMAMLMTDTLCLLAGGSTLFLTSQDAAMNMHAGGLLHFPIMISEGLTELVIKINSILSADGAFSALSVSVNAGFIFLFYISIFLISSEWMRIKMLRHEVKTAIPAAAWVLIISICIGLASYNVFVDDEVVFVSVGQGDCTHIRAGGKDVLIDGGGNTERNIGQDVLMPYLLSNGAERLELGLVTHLHTDHYRGIYELNEVYPVGRIGIPEDYSNSIEKARISEQAQSIALEGRSDREPEDNTKDMKQIKQMKIPDNIMYVAEGSRIMLTDDVYIDPIWPIRGTGKSIAIDDPNENNMVYIVNYKGVKIMVTGDLLEEDELAMISHYAGTDMLDCDILKVGHHGSKTSSSEAFLDAVSPDIAVIQVGRNNMYGHPHAQTLDRLEKRGIKVLRTDLNGAVGIDIRGTRLKVDKMR